MKMVQEQFFWRNNQKYAKLYQNIIRLKSKSDLELCETVCSEVGVFGHTVEDVA